MSYFLLSLLYSLIIRIRNVLFDIGILRERRLPVPVISVGNLTVGGSGKTPMTLLIGSLFKSRGQPFGVLSRGYGRKSSIPFFLQDSRNVTADQIGDEPKMIGEKLGCLLGIGANRFRIGSVMIRKFSPVPMILDDGFSHRHIYRDLDLLVINGADPWGGKGMLPYGLRREPLSSLSRADAAVITRDNDTLDDTPIRAKLAALRFSKPLFTAKRIPEQITDPDGKTHPLSDYHDKPFYLFSGIANGDRFEGYAKSCGLTVSGSISYSDHFRFNEMEINQIRQNAKGALLLTTEKDFYRLGPLAKDIHYLSIKLVVDQGKMFEDFIFQAIQS